MIHLFFSKKRGLILLTTKAFLVPTLVRDTVSQVCIYSGIVIIIYSRKSSSKSKQINSSCTGNPPYTRLENSINHWGTFCLL